MRTSLTIYAWCGLALLGLATWLLGCGCQTTSGTSAISPARLEAVTTWGAYLGGQALIAQGRRAELTLALSALEPMATADQADLGQAVLALRAAGVEELNTPEGLLLVATGLIFVDNFHGVTTQVAEGPQGQAVMRGLVAGFRLALSHAPAKFTTTRGRIATSTDGIALGLQRWAEATR